MRSESSNRNIKPAIIREMPNGDLIIGPVRASYPHLKNGQVDSKSGKTRFTLACLLPPGTDIQKLLDIGEEQLREKAPGLKDKRKPIPTSVKRGVRPASDYAGKMGYEDGWHFIHTMTYDNPPAVVAFDKTTILPPDAIYPGCWVAVRITPFVYLPRPDAPGTGISWGLNTVQFLYDDKRIDTRIAPTDAFADVEWEDDEEPGAGDPDDPFA